MQGLNAIPVIGWALSFIFTTSLALPFWICWTCCQIGKTYFGFLPDVYLAPGFWSIVGLFICVGIIKIVFVPTLASQSNTNNKD